MKFSQNNIFSFLMGVIISSLTYYLIFSQNKSVLREEIKLELFSQIPKINFEGISKEGKQYNTQDITQEEAKKFKQNFQDIIKPISIPGGYKLIAWPESMLGWFLDANKLEKFILNQNLGERDNEVNNISLDLGYNIDHFTLVIQGASVIDSNKNIKTYKMIDKKATSNINVKSNILEYVNPCKPNCPD